MSNYPTPKRSDYPPSDEQTDDSQYLDKPDQDVGFTEKTMDDGRPCRIELWSDPNLEVDCKTFFYSTIDIEDWNKEDHEEYLDRHNLLENEMDEDSPNLNAKTIDDDGNEMWSVTTVIRQWSS